MGGFKISSKREKNIGQYYYLPVFMIESLMSYFDNESVVLVKDSP